MIRYRLRLRIAKKIAAVGLEFRVFEEQRFGFHSGRRGGEKIMDVSSVSFFSGYNKYHVAYDESTIVQSIGFTNVQNGDETVLSYVYRRTTNENGLDYSVMGR